MFIKIYKLDIRPLKLRTLPPATRDEYNLKSGIKYLSKAG